MSLDRREKATPFASTREPNMPWVKDTIQEPVPAMAVTAFAMSGWSRSGAARRWVSLATVSTQREAEKRGDGDRGVAYGSRGVDARDADPGGSKGT